MRIFEAITTIPNLRVFYTNREKEFTNAIPVILTGMADFFDFEKNQDNDLSYFDRLLQKMDVPHPSKYAFRELSDRLDRLKSDCRNILDHGNVFRKYFASDIKFLEEHTANHDTNAWDDVVEKASSELEYEFGNLEEPECQRILKALNGIQRASRTATTLYANVQKYKMVLKAIEKKENFSYNPDSYRPDHDEIEKLYHVSMYCDQILESGFQAEKPQNMLGVGNFGNQSKISFTHDQAVAQSILRAFRDIWMIVHGQLKTSQILDWIDRDGVSHEDIKKGIGGFYPNDKTKYIPKNIKETITLYRYWLLHQKMRIDPWIVNINDLAEAMNSVEYKSIGMLVCEVKLEGKEQYLHAEREFRVKPDQVLSVKRLV